MEFFVHRTDSLRRFVAAQVVYCDFAAHKLTRPGHLDPLGHGFVRFEFLLHDSSFFLRRGGGIDLVITLNPAHLSI